MSTWVDLRDNPRLRKIFEERSAIIRLTREFFWARGFIETDTPLAVRYPGQEPYLWPVPLEFHDPQGESRWMYLHTSPEYSLKKILAAGFSKIFSITKTFRDYESFGGTHNPEFTMIEWYRAPGTYRDFMDDMEALYKYVGEKMGIEELGYKDYKIKYKEIWDRKSLKELWQEYIGVNLDDYLTVSALRGLVEQLGFKAEATDEYEDLFFKIFLNKIEPSLGRARPVFVYDYPAQMCSLSRPSVDPRYAERVECYIGGLEMCNGFGELTDPDKQKAQLERDRALRQKLGKQTWPVDPDFITALRSGIGTPRDNEGLPAIVPPGGGTAAGVAMGVDRMVLLFTGAKDINEVIFGSVADQWG